MYRVNKLMKNRRKKKKKNPPSPAPRVVLRVFVVFDDGHRRRRNDAQRQVPLAAVGLIRLALEDQAGFGTPAAATVSVVVFVFVVVIAPVPAIFRSVGRLLLLLLLLFVLPSVFAEPSDGQADQEKSHRGRQRDDRLDQHRSEIEAQVQERDQRIWQPLEFLKSRRIPKKKKIIIYVYASYCNRKQKKNHNIIVVIIG